MTASDGGGPDDGVNEPKPADRGAVEGRAGPDDDELKGFCAAGAGKEKGDEGEVDIAAIGLKEGGFIAFCWPVGCANCPWGNGFVD